MQCWKVLYEECDARGFLLCREAEGEVLKRKGTVYESDSRKAVRIHHGEFDPGSEQTLAACLKHAS